MRKGKGFLTLLLGMALSMGLVQSAYAASYAAVSMDANVLGLGFLIEPTLVDISDQARASAVIADLMQENITTPDGSQPWLGTGDVESGFYLAAVYCAGQENAKMADYITAVVDEGGVRYSSREDDWLGEFDYNDVSGWMYSINGSFPPVGAADYHLADNDVMRWQFTVYGYGADLNAEKEAWGKPGINKGGNKDALTWDVAVLRSKYDDAVLEANAVYTAAMALLNDPQASQVELDKAKQDLAKVAFGESSVEDTVEDTDTTPANVSFADTEGHWAAQAITYVADKGLMKGEENNKFNPDNALNRAMLVTMLYRMENAPEVTGASSFVDVAAGQWYTDAVIWAAANGIVNGKEGGRFAPLDNITREEMAAILMRYAEAKGVDVSQAGDLSAFADAAAVSAWALANMQWANAAGLIGGDEVGKLNPQGKATRAEAAAILVRYLENTVK